MNNNVNEAKQSVNTMMSGIANEVQDYHAQQIIIIHNDGCFKDSALNVMY